MNVLITGSKGFIGRNLVARIAALGHHVLEVTSNSTKAQIVESVRAADAVFHLAGANRPAIESDYVRVNVGFTETLLACIEIEHCGIPVHLASSIQADLSNPYGESKRLAERAVSQHCDKTKSSGSIFRLPNVFGKWCRPNYNSVVATFCYNITHGLELEVHNPDHKLNLVYIDDVVDCMIRTLDCIEPGCHFRTVEPIYSITVGELKATLEHLWTAREQLRVLDVGTGFNRALYSTLISYAKPESMCYPIKRHVDNRGAFAEFLRFNASGQISYFTANPGITRGGHFHHTKLEKFLVVRGQATFRMRNIDTGESFKVIVCASNPTVVETAPGWAHEITNTGTEELLVLLWANEVFDPNSPDTVPYAVRG
jgi:UDP-2-acetamido-2,6-beta-L-arabino-hexul-4-ose reductase